MTRTCVSSRALPNGSDLDAISDPGRRIIVSCEQAKTWLAEALDGNQIEQIIEIKSQAEAIRVYTIQKQLGKDAQFSAQEIVRRAQRCLGLAIRKGQQEGRIAKSGDKGAMPKPRFAGQRGGGRPGDARGQQLGKSSDHFSDSHEQADAYAMSDGVSQPQFEKAIREGRAEGNLSRKNIARKLKGNGAVDRWAELPELAASGYTSNQIAKKFGVTQQTVTKKALKWGIEIQADRLVSHARKPNADRIFKEFVGALEALAPSCELIDVPSLSTDVINEYAPVMIDAIKALRKLERQLKGVWNG